MRPRLRTAGGSVKGVGPEPRPGWPGGAEAWRSAGIRPKVRPVTTVDTPPRDALLALRDGGRRVPGREPATGGDSEGSLGRRWIWRLLHLTLEPDEILAVQGPTGAGKSLLLRALAGLDALDEGQVFLLGRPCAAWDVTRYRSVVAYLHQSPALFPGRIEENLREPFGYAVRGDRAYDRRRALEILEPLGHSAGFLERGVEGLSGGERQIVALVRTILTGPRVLLLDEPTAALDPSATGTVEALVRRWLEAGPVEAVAASAAGDGDGAPGYGGAPDGRGVIWVTHDEAQARRAAHRRLRLAEGRLTPT